MWNKNDERDRSGPVPLSWGSPVGKRNLRWKGFVEKVGFEPGVKDRRSDKWREWGWWQRWVDRGKSRQEWWGWRNESGSWFQRRSDAYLKVTHLTESHVSIHCISCMHLNSEPSSKLPVQWMRHSSRSKSGQICCLICCCLILFISF